MTSPPPGQWRPPPAGPPQGPPFGPPPWGPQQPPGPPNRGNGLKWVLGAVVLLVVVAVTVGATLLFTGKDPTDSPPASSTAQPSTSAVASDIASADDTGPVGIITEDPTCAPWTPIGDTLAAQQRNGWDRRDPSIPATDWTPEQRAQYEVVGQGMRTAADQTVRLAQTTPHRVMRELYEQAIAYWRAYADSLSEYRPADNRLTLVADSVSGALVWICAASKYGSASARTPLVAQAAPPSQVAPVSNSSDPQRFLLQANVVCRDWAATLSRFNADTDNWVRAIDPGLPASQWSPEQRTLFTNAAPVLRRNANEIQQLGIRSDNPVLEDFAVLASQYQRAYLQSFPTYTPPDNFLDSVASRLVVAIDQACLAAEG